MSRRGGKVATTVSRSMFERKRRMFTKHLFSKLASVINPTPLAPKTSIELLDQAAAHVKELQQRVEMLKQRKKLLESSTSEESAEMRGSVPTVFTVTDLDSAVEVCLISRSKDEFILTQVIDVLEKEAARVVAVSYSRVGDMINYRIYSEAVCSRIGIDSSMVGERLRRLTARP